MRNLHLKKRVFPFLMLLLLSSCGGGGSSSSEPVSPPPPPPPDVTAPVITLVGDNPQILITGNTYVELGATASDNIDGDLTASIVIDATAVDSAIPGNYTVTYDVTDAAGNAAATASRTVTVSDLPTEPVLSASAEIKKINFSWTASQGAEYYRLLENPDGSSGFTQVGDDLSLATQQYSIDISAHLFDFVDAQYIIEACHQFGCASSSVLTVFDLMLDTIGYFKASDTDQNLVDESAGDLFGSSVALSSDGTTLAVGAPMEDSAATGINGDQTDNSLRRAGAAYVFRNDGTGWYQEAYIKASNTDQDDEFGFDLDLSGDGNTLVVGAPRESSSSTGINGDEGNTEIGWVSGAAYVFRFDGANWYQEAYIKASVQDGGAKFGYSVAISNSGNKLLVGAIHQESEGGIPNQGAAYVFSFDGSFWQEEAAIGAANGGSNDYFGYSVALSDSGDVAVISAVGEDSSATGINGDETDSSMDGSGAAYVFRFDGSDWSQDAYIKASNTEMSDEFGHAVAISGDGNTLAIGAPSEDGNSQGINGDGSLNGFYGAGAVYLYRFTTSWSQEAYIKGDNPWEMQWLGSSLALSSDGNLLAVGAKYGDFGSPGVTVWSKSGGGAKGQQQLGHVYMFEFDNGWSEKSQILATFPDTDDEFHITALSADGGTLAIGAPREGSVSTGIGGDDTDNSGQSIGAVYLH